MSRWKAALLRIPADRAAAVAFAIAAIFAFGLFLFLGRELTFWHDEWGWISERQAWSLDSFMRPHNEHWMATVALIYKLMLSTIGLQSYAPYHAVLLTFHVVTAAGLFVIISRKADAFLALLAGVLFLFLGSGDQNLFWGAGLPHVLACASGVWALALLLEREVPSRRALTAVAALLVIGIASQGPALFFVLAAAAIVLFNPARRGQAWVLVPVGLAYGGWLLSYGQGTLSSPGTGGGAQAIIAYFLSGLGQAPGALFGVGYEIGLIVAVLLILAAAWQLVKPGRQDELLTAGIAGFLGQYGLLALSRAHLGPDQAAASRYVYVAAVFLLIAVAAGLMRLFGRTQLKPHLALAVLIIAGWGLLANLSHILPARAFYLEKSHEVRAAITIETRYGGSPAIPADRHARETGYPFFRRFPGPAELSAILSKYGSPVSDSTPPIPTSTYERILFVLVSPSITVTLQDDVPLGAIQPPARSIVGLETRTSGRCLELRPVGDDPRVMMRLAGGSMLYASSSDVAEAELFLSLGDGYKGQPMKSLPVMPARITVVTIPDLGDGTSWLARFDPPPITSTQLCMTPPTH